MSRTLTILHSGWASARALARGGRRAHALAVIEQLLSRPDVPAPIAADARRLAGELELYRERYAAARRHLRAAAALEPTHAETHYRLGLAHERDPHGDDRLAAVRFKKASKLEPDNPLYRAAFGRAAVRCDRVKAGVRALLAAADAAPGDTPVLRVVVGGLLEAGKPGAARRVVDRARFLCPANRELDAIREQVRFENARRRQQNERSKQDAPFATEGEFVLLPFVRVVGGSGRAKAGVIRRDRVSMPRPHLARLHRADR
jgi:Flp pilus assembly protein TadD